MPDATAVDELYLGIGDRIRRIREESGTTQATLAERIGLSRASVANIERGRQHPPIHTAYAIAQAFGLQLFDLLRDDPPHLLKPVPKAPKVPASVGFAIVEMIEAGLLDDCLHVIGRHAAMRSGRLANQRAATEKQIAEINRPQPRLNWPDDSSRPRPRQR